MHSDRLLKLAELLEADAANPVGIQFDLGVWGEADSDQPVSLSCGTQACAMGLAVLSGAFEQYGLLNGANVPYLIIPEMVAIPGFTNPVGFAAAERLFGILYDDAVRLFSPDYYAGVTVGAEGELVVASRIREFVADNQAGG
jgi:hypothetical protein